MTLHLAHLDCPRGEDEIGCNPRLCPNTLQCPNETKCVQPDQICDNHMDCKDGFDEARCPKLFCDDEDFSCYVEKSRRKISNGEDPTIIIIFLLVVFFLIFLLLLCKCVGSRQDVRDMLEHPLDIPLPPFRGKRNMLNTFTKSTFYQYHNKIMYYCIQKYQLWGSYNTIFFTHFNLSTLKIFNVSFCETNKTYINFNAPNNFSKMHCLPEVPNTEYSVTSPKNKKNISYNK